ncbi:hypothetical protein M378DRAFT_1032878 [Amanita muscaria Koide BX008]|uniref:MFS general substrate transporter n=1 Tax=Amanita muscaria (strain Koide BX008) TaxID=946122 RepID=A0A0C2XAI7_AMAMK|nr:hypothetical protein M378DRAFT_1032878 [Amanita muscaria Koide BX008]
MVEMLPYEGEISALDDEKAIFRSSSPIEPVKPLSQEEPVYRLYRQRFVGLAALVLLNIAAALSWTWFGPISNDAAEEFGISLNDVNWLGNIVACVYLPMALLIPSMVSKFGIGRCCQIAAVALIISSWVRYAGTIHTLSGGKAYGLLILGQVFSAIAQPIYQVIGSKYSETWFDLKGRTTATMVVAIANPVGCALGQLFSPMFSNTRQSILYLGVVSTAVTPLAFLVLSTPPTPPTYAASKPTGNFASLLRAIIGKINPSSDSYMSVRSRIDFALVTLIFGILVGATNSFSILTGQIFEPVGYDATTSGLFGACLLLTGIGAAAITAPLFDRVFTHHLAITIKVLVPPLSGAWLSLVWAVKPNNTGGLFAIMTILGITSITLLPVALELCADLTKNAEGSSAILWFMGNLIGIPFLLVQQALRAGSDASPPDNMQRALIFNGAFVMTTAGLVFLIQGRQERKRLDEEKLKDFVRDVSKS